MYLSNIILKYQYDNFVVYCNVDGIGTVQFKYELAFIYRMIKITEHRILRVIF